MVWPTVRPARSGRTPPSSVAPAPFRQWILASVFLVVTTGLACEPTDPARAGAERFIDRYYVEIDLPAAKDHAVGFALVKLDREIGLLEGIDGPESSGKPDVNYRFLTERAGSDADHRGFLYELTIHFGGGQVVRRALVTVQEADGGWRVANFQELD